MRLEAGILITVPIISILSLIFVPKNMLFRAHFILLFVQFPTWILGLSAVQLGMIEYVVLPIMCIHFYVHFPERSSKAVKMYVLLWNHFCVYSDRVFFREIYFAFNVYWLANLLDLY